MMLWLQLDDFLRDAYRYLQIMAVALEQVEWDQGDGGNPAYQESFRKVMQRLRLVRIYPVCNFCRS